MSQYPMTRGANQMMYKTRMCHKSLQGSCPNGDNCSFAHGHTDLREPPQMCINWETTDKCVFGDKCHFAHGLGELHMPVANMEGDVPIATNSLRLPVTELPPNGSAIGVSLQQGEGTGFANLKLSHKKINGIYGDWIDDEEDEQNN